MTMNKTSALFADEKLEEARLAIPVDSWKDNLIGDELPLNWKQSLIGGGLCHSCETQEDMMPHTCSKAIGIVVVDEEFIAYCGTINNCDTFAAEQQSNCPEPDGLKFMSLGLDEVDGLPEWEWHRNFVQNKPDDWDEIAATRP